MKVTLSDSLIMVEGWDHSFDRLGEYTLKTRKTPEEIRSERDSGVRKVDRMRKERKSLFTFEGTAMFCYAGLWPRISEALSVKGIVPEIEDRRNPAIRPMLDVSRMDPNVQFRTKQLEAVALIASSDGGIIKCCTAWGKSFLISVLCRCLPTLNIVIATSSVMVVSTLYEYLLKQVPGEVGVLGGGKDTTFGKRIVVTTLKSLPNIPEDRVQLLLVDEVHDVGDNTYGEAVSKFGFARRFGFTASDVRNDGSRLVLEALFGPVILEMSYDEAAEAGMVTPMKYLMLPCSRGPEVLRKIGTDQDVLMKRFAYWCNSHRNGVIASFVRDLKQVYDGQILIMVGERMLCPWDLNCKDIRTGGQFAAKL